MKVFIIGGSGLVGGNCLKYFRAQGAEVMASHRAFKTDDTVFYDCCVPDHIDNFDIKSYKPEVIILCGALTHVDYCEENEEESYARTVATARHISELCQEIGAKLVYTSTDYVFDGKNGPYTEDAKMNPLSVYARHKIEAEEIINSALPDALIYRITNVYGDEIRGKNFVARIVNDIKDGREWTMRLPSDQYATPVNAFDIARATWLLLNDNKAGVYNIASTDFVNRCQLAHRVLKHFPDHKCTVVPVTTKELNQTADRPLVGGLITAKFLGEYPDFHFSNVDDYLIDVKSR
jgi:dTDP-4-dehydrorhamnose reductase